MSTYLVTGAAGFIASKVCEMLLAAGHTVVGIDNLNDYYDVRLKDWRLSRLLGAASRELGADPKKSVYAGCTNLEAQGSKLIAAKSGRFVFCQLDIENRDAMDRLFAQWDFATVFNLAARAGVRASLENPEIYRTTNVLGEENVLKCQVKYGVKKHVLASSSSVYAGCPMPFVEDAVLGKMQSPYAETKRQAELLALDYHQKHGLDVSVLRYFTVFGPAGRPDMAPFRFIKWIDEGTPITLYGDGTQARDFTYVDDIARGTIMAGQLFGGKMLEIGDRRWPMPGSSQPLATNSERSSGSEQPVSSAKLIAPNSDLRTPLAEPQTSGFVVINLGGGNNPITLHTMIKWIEEALSAERAKNPQVSGFRSQVSRKAIINRLPPSAADMKETWADITKAKRLLDWAPQVTPADGFRWTVEWYLENSEWIKGIKP